MRRRARTEDLPIPPDEIADGARVEVWARDAWLELVATELPLEDVGDAMWSVGVLAQRNYTDARREWARLYALTPAEVRRICPSTTPRWPSSDTW